MINLRHKDFPGGSIIQGSRTAVQSAQKDKSDLSWSDRSKLAPEGAGAAMIRRNASPNGWKVLHNRFGKDKGIFDI